jgi:adenosylcobinamide-GDP ribazoletransferase
LTCKDAFKRSKQRQNVMSSSKKLPRFPWLHLPRKWGAQFLGAVVFYTSIPLPHDWPLRFDGIARYAPLVGFGIGGVVWGGDRLLSHLGMPLATRCVLVVGFWLLMTGGLHLDGVMDTADGLAVPDRARRLEVMADSRTGAFGVMAACFILALKAVSVADLERMRGFGLLAAAGWSRWGQVVAIAAYPYLRPQGKGALHKAHAHPATDWLVGFCALLMLFGITCWVAPAHWRFLLSATVGGCVIALLTGAWLKAQLGGHTGDTYGAIVEWTEALLLCLMVGLQTFA